MADNLAAVNQITGEPVICAHGEMDIPVVTANPKLIYDYHGFPGNLGYPISCPGPACPGPAVGRAV